MEFIQKVIDSYDDHTGLWKDELSEWVPDEIFDAHVHLGPAGIAQPIQPHRRMEALTTFTSLSWEQARDFYPQLYSGKKITGLIAFGFPLREIDLPAANRYLAHIARLDRRIHPFILADPLDIAGTLRQYHQIAAQGVRFVGVKPYYDLLRIEKPNSVFHCRDIDFTPPPLLEFMNDQGLALMLHTSSIGGGDPQVRSFIQMAATRFDRIRIILAHMCRYTDPRQFQDFISSTVLDHPNVYLEMSSASSAMVYEQVLSRPDLWNRLLFGSDIPFGLITGAEMWSPTHGPIFLTREDYAWSDPRLNAQFDRERRAMTYNTYHTIHALKQAMDPLQISIEEKDRLKRAIFSQNAAQLLQIGR